MITIQRDVAAVGAIIYSALFHQNGSTTAQYAFISGQFVPLSEQNIIDCSLDLGETYLLTRRFDDNMLFRYGLLSLLRILLFSDC